MGIDDRSYMFEEGNTRLGRFSLGLPRPTPVVRYLLIINVLAFIFQTALTSRIWLDDYFGVTVGGFYQVWRYVTFQFLHAGFWHIAMNMLGLYFLGTMLERQWGSRRFLGYYLMCGVFAGLAYVLVGFGIGGLSDTPLVGASGGVYGILLAVAVLMPHVRVILFIFPVPVRLAALLIFGMMIWGTMGTLLQRGASPSFWSDVAHLGGAIGGAIMLALSPLLKRQSLRLQNPLIKPGAWQRRLEREQEEDQQIDQILRKIHDQGIGSLTSKEKRILQDATRRQRERQGSGL